jgi:hypothetical protein
MAVNDESIGFGGTVELNDGPGDTFVVIPKVTSLGVPSATVGTVESKRLDLTGGVIVKLATLINGGSVTIKHQFTHAQFARLETVRKARIEKLLRVTVPDDDGNTEVTVPVLLTQNKTSDLDAEKITEIDSMFEVSGDEP